LADAQEVFAPLEQEETATRFGLLTTPTHHLHAEWQERVRPAIERITGPLPDAQPSADGRTRRTDAFRWLHGEFTMVARAEAGATW